VVTKFSEARFPTQMQNELKRFENTIFNELMPKNGDNFEIRSLRSEIGEKSSSVSPANQHPTIAPHSSITAPRGVR
jgi:hypothetical protein